MPPKSASNANASAPTPAGIINVNPTTLQPAQAKSARLKVVVRRLPPGLTREEFETSFGEEWKIGGGKIDWIEYRTGKIRSPGKHPEQSRAYLHLTSESHVKPFENKFLAITFHDAKGTHRHPDLKYLPPTLEFASLQRVPTGKPRFDSRQGLIDQDPEYMAFLEGETMAIPKAPAIDSNLTERTKEHVTSTPLIEALREKKAAKAKALAAKAAKQAPKAEEQASPEKAKTVKGRKGRDEAKPVVKDVKNKELTKTSNKESRPAPDAQAPAAATASPPLARRRERAPANIKSMLQRDLGLAPSPRKSNKDTPQAELTPSPDKKGQLQPTEPLAASSRNARLKKDGQTAAKAAPTEAGKGHVNAQAPPRAPKSGQGASVPTPANPTALTPQSGNQTTRPPKAPAKPSPGATKAYLKHANASQGVTEELLRTALATFGEILSLEIDKRKGTALAEFKTTESLAAAMAKRSVPVAQGAVEVLEYKEKPAGTARGVGSGRGTNRGHRGRGGSRGASGGTPPVAAATAATANPG